jgi:hypothetical protein
VGISDSPRRANRKGTRMSVITVCKNVIQSNNKNGWTNPDPAIRIATSSSGKVTARGHTVEIKDRFGDTVATIFSTQDGEPIIKCGAKVAIFTEYEPEVIS